MIEVRIQVPEGALASLKADATAFGEEMRIAAAVKWYEQRRVSQGRAAEIAGLSRSQFLDALSRYEVSAFQYDADEVLAELADG